MHRRRNRLPDRRIRLIPVYAAVLSVAAGCGRPSAPDDAQARRVVERFLEQLRTGTVDAAWESTTADFKSDEGRDAFRRFVKGRPVLHQPLEFTTIKQVEVNGLARWEATLRPPAATQDAPGAVRVLIAQESGVWKVERLTTE